MTKAANSNAASTTSEEIYCVSYLRGLAALGVVLYHVRVDLWIGFHTIRENPSLAGPLAEFAAWLSLPTAFMSSGVMLFFVISGFCIHYPYGGPNGKPLDLQEYVVRRFFRIYPPYIVAVLFALAVQWIGYRHGFLQDLDGRDYQLSAFMLQNTFGRQPDCNPALWTIPVEVAFYIFFPLVYFGLRRSWPVTLAAGLVVSLIAIASSLISPIQFSFLPYWFTWIAGATLAEQHKKGNLKQPPLWICGMGILFFFLGLLCAWRVRVDNAPVVGGLTDLITLLDALAFGVAFTVLLWWSIVNQRFYNRFPASMHGFLMFLGAISYSLYLFHTPFFRLCGWVWVSWIGEKPVNYCVTFPFVILALGVAWIAYKCIEAPAHIAGRKLAYSIKCRHAQRAQRRVEAAAKTVL
ncbi:MAG: acyltransferase [Methylacidiphilales bacterium]|nr:acyltransferase [Candidatus Methylacidiphilales bacterium]